MSDVWYKVIFIGLCILFVINLIYWMNVFRMKKIKEYRMDIKGYQTDETQTDDISDTDYDDQHKV